MRIIKTKKKKRTILEYFEMGNGQIKIHGSTFCVALHQEYINKVIILSILDTNIGLYWTLYC